MKMFRKYIFKVQYKTKIIYETKQKKIDLNYLKYNLKCNLNKI